MPSRVLIQFHVQDVITELRRRGGSAPLEEGGSFAYGLLRTPDDAEGKRRNDQYVNWVAVEAMKELVELGAYRAIMDDKRRVKGWEKVGYVDGIAGIAADLWDGHVADPRHKLHRSRLHELMDWEKFRHYRQLVATNAEDVLRDAQLVKWGDDTIHLAPIDWAWFEDHTPGRPLYYTAGGRRKPRTYEI